MALYKFVIHFNLTLGFWQKNKEIWRNLFVQNVYLGILGAITPFASWLRYMPTYKQ